MPLPTRTRTLGRTWCGDGDSKQGPSFRPLDRNGARRSCGVLRGRTRGAACRAPAPEPGPCSSPRSLNHRARGLVRQEHVTRATVYRGSKRGRQRAGWEAGAGGPSSSREGHWACNETKHAGPRSRQATTACSQGLAGEAGGAIQTKSALACAALERIQGEAVGVPAGPAGLQGSPRGFGCRRAAHTSRRGGGRGEDREKGGDSRRSYDQADDAPFAGAAASVPEACLPSLGPGGDWGSRHSSARCTKGVSHPRSDDRQYKRRTGSLASRCASSCQAHPFSRAEPGEGGTVLRMWERVWPGQGSSGWGSGRHESMGRQLRSPRLGGGEVRDSSTPRPPTSASVRGDGTAPPRQRGCGQT